MFAVTSQTATVVAGARAAVRGRGVSVARGVSVVKGVQHNGGVARAAMMGVGGASKRQQSLRMGVRTGAAGGDAAMGGGSMEVFPRTKERDPYRRLGIGKEATYEEVQDARNYLVEQFSGHTAGVEAIEQAFDKIIQEKLSSRKKVKGLNIKKRKAGEEYVPPFLERFQAMFARPDNQTIVRRAVLYAIMGGWAIVQSTAASGPAFQMAISFGLCVYFLNTKRGGKALGKAFLNSFVALLLGWLVGSIFPVYIPIFPGSFSPELILSLFSFVSFFIVSTFLI
mmetsp:Transcript_38444/g.95362  ORF Transcript_38444/g.95362 Transcript_38444/m.95362 type:complete len:282 (+) Transcript_38444:41-886(+)